MIRFRDKRFLAVAIVVAALVVFVLPAFVAFRYTAPEQRGQFLSRPWRGWSFAYAALAVPGDAELKTSGMALRKADWVFKGTAVDPREVQLLFVSASVRTRSRTTSTGGPSRAPSCPATASSGRSRATVDTISDQRRHHRRAAGLQLGRLLYDVRDDLTPAELAPRPADATSPSPAP